MPAEQSPVQLESWKRVADGAPQCGFLGRAGPLGGPEHARASILCGSRKGMNSLRARAMGSRSVCQHRWQTRKAIFFPKEGTFWSPHGKWLGTKLLPSRRGTECDEQWRV